MKLWSGRFSATTHELVDEYNASIGFDYQLADFDIIGSLAHVEMLAHCDLIEQESVDKIIAGLKEIRTDLHAGKLSWSVAHEDVHMNIEHLLHEKIGPVAGKLHTGRSRNDQVALDLHLYLRHHIDLLVQEMQGLIQILVDLAKDHVDTIMPGYTHLQRAEPVRFAHHLCAYANMFQRDMQRLKDCYVRVNVCPLGAGALAGSGMAVDRHYVAKALGFEAIYQNSLDAVSDRDFVIEFLSIAATVMMHFSKLSEEMVLWCSAEFSFIELDDQFTTGSSMMPQKKNPDVAELARGKTGRVYGALMSILTMLKGLPLAYNKDMQEDKESLFDVVKTLHQTLGVYSPMLETMKVNQANMLNAVENDYSNATQLANYLVEKGIPFREAHHITGKMVADCIQENVLLKEVALEKFQQYHPQIQQDIYAFLTAEAVVEAHKAEGGTARQSVLQQIQQIEQGIK